MTVIAEALGDGRKIVTAAATRERLVATGTWCHKVAITALSTNTGVIVVGGATVIAAAGTRRGTPLLAGETIEYQVKDLYQVWLDATVNGEGVSFSYETKQGY